MELKAESDSTGCCMTLVVSRSTPIFSLEASCRRYVRLTCFFMYDGYDSVIRLCMKKVTNGFAYMFR